MATWRRKRLKAGDVLEVMTPKVLAYIQYLGKHSCYGDTIRVLPGFHTDRPEDFGPLVAEPGYVTFYPAGAAVAQRLVDIATSAALPAGVGVPTKLRRSGAMTNSGKTLAWIVEDGEKETLRRKLTEAEKKLPIVEILSHDCLITDICDGWSPEQDV